MVKMTDGMHLCALCGVWCYLPQHFVYHSDAHRHQNKVSLSKEAILERLDQILVKTIEKGTQSNNITDAECTTGQPDYISIGSDSDEYVMTTVNNSDTGNKGIELANAAVIKVTRCTERRC